MTVVMAWDKLPFASSTSKSYVSAKNQKWSKWNANNQDDDFYSCIRKALEGSNVSPIDCETKAWIITVKKRNALKVGILPKKPVCCTTSCGLCEATDGAFIVDEQNWRC